MSVFYTLVIYLLQLAALLGFLLYLLFRKRGFIDYYYKPNPEKKYRVPLGYVKKDGSIIDYNKPKGQRKVGYVVTIDNKAYVRISKGENDYDELGFVNLEGEIFATGLSDMESKVGTVDRHGTRYFFWELCLYLNSEVSLDSTDPYGRCYESGRFKSPHNNITLLMKAGAVLLLYFKNVKYDDIPQSRLYNKYTDTALISALIYTILYAPIYLLTGGFKLFQPVLGVMLSQSLTLFAFFTLIWIIMHFVKISLLSESNKIVKVLMLINRNTGLRFYNNALIILLLIGLIYSITIEGYVFMPLFAALLTGILVNSITYTYERWYVRPVYEGIRYIKIDPSDATSSGEIKEKSFTVELDSPLKGKVPYNFNIKIDFDEISQLRTENPFKNDVYSEQFTGAVQKVIDKSLINNHSRELYNKLAEIAINNSLSKFETIQLILDFVQEPTIKYELDSKCYEIGNRLEYVRFLPETLLDGRGDCDCKSAMAVSLYRLAGYDVLYLISSKAEHAAIAVEENSEIREFVEDGTEGVLEYNGKIYYYCETTGDNWTIGTTPDFMKNINSGELIIIPFTKQ